MTKRILKSGVFCDSPFSLADVGASGGISRFWDVFGQDLRAYGFDSLIHEVERLNAACGPNRRYYAYRVGDSTYQPPRGVPDSQPFPRTSAVRALELMKVNYETEYFDQSGSGQHTTEMIELDRFFLEAHPTDVDFIKIDTDGSDYQVLRGARRLLSGGVLGVAIESQFHGLVHDESNTFRNIDRLLTAHGFSLFDLEVYRYSRAALPKLFTYNIPAQTVSGQVLWADAIYLRDFGKPDYESEWSIRFAPSKILKLACLFEIFGLQDCAAELLVKHRAAVAAIVDVDRCLDDLTPDDSVASSWKNLFAGRKRSSYSDYVRRFEQNPASFYPSRRR